MRFTDQYVDLKLAWSPKAVAAWGPPQLARAELGDVRESVQRVLAAMTCPDRRTDLTDQRQLAQALTHLRRLRALWATILEVGVVEPTGENQLPPWALQEADTFNVREWTFSRERLAITRRSQYVTVARQKDSTTNRMANRIATYYNTDIQGLLIIRGK